MQQALQDDSMAHFILGIVISTFGLLLAALTWFVKDKMKTYDAHVTNREFHETLADRAKTALGIQEAIDNKAELIESDMDGRGRLMDEKYRSLTQTVNETREDVKAILKIVANGHRS